MGKEIGTHESTGDTRIAWAYAELNADCIGDCLKGLRPLELQPFKNAVITVPHVLQASPLSIQKPSATQLEGDHSRCVVVNMTSFSFPSEVQVEWLKAAFTWTHVCAQALTGVIAVIVWRKCFSTISDVPGPFLASFTRLWHLVRIFIGDQNLRMIELHDKHGLYDP